MLINQKTCNNTRVKRGGVNYEDKLYDDRRRSGCGTGDFQGSRLQNDQVDERGAGKGWGIVGAGKIPRAFWEKKFFGYQTSA